MAAADDWLRSAALFSFFSLLSDRQALRVSKKISDKVKKFGEEEQEVQFVRFSYRLWRKYIRRQVEFRTDHKLWKLPYTIDIGVWTEFRQKSSEEEFLAVLWAKVLGISENSIAQGLGVSAGTITYRLSRGLRMLGEFCDEGRHV